MMVLVLRRCPVLEELALQMVLGPPNSNTADTELPVSLPRLRFFLLCDEMIRWRYLRPKLSIPESASIHPDLILPRQDMYFDCYDRFAEEAARECLSWPGFPTCRVIILHYQVITPTDSARDRVAPELVRIAFASGEEDAWGEKDPEQKTRRWTLTFRIPGRVLETRYPPGPLDAHLNVKRINSPEDVVGSIFRGIAQASAHAPLVDLTATEVLIVKAGGRLRHMAEYHSLTCCFPNLTTLVVYGVFDRNFYALKGVLRELCDGRWLNLEQVRLPDYIGQDCDFDWLEKFVARAIKFSK
ncbi:unnamed protein product [Peniophora sp. CBMAI 1063]|nr:unnamed protein product [Peniophora sp. CBMAI 1063]